MNPNEYPIHCYYCNITYFADIDAYERHIVTRHRGLPGYPGPADLKVLNLKPQGMSWEAEIKQKEYFEHTKRRLR